MKNEYDVRGDITAIIINSPKYGRQEALISTSKLDCAKEFVGSWYVQWANNTKSFYVKGQMYKQKGKQTVIRLHRWITNAPDGMHIDHIDHDTLNNIDSNLRSITISQNGQNRKGAQRNSKSGIRGVSWHKMANKWQVQIQINKVVNHVGRFDTLEEAERASIEARLKYMPYSQEASL